MNNDIWFYEKLNQFDAKFNKDILKECHLTGEEIDIGYSILNKETGVTKKYNEFVHTAQRQGKNYVVPSTYVEQKMLPILCSEDYTIKISVKSKAYLKIKECQSVRTVPELTMTYKQMIDMWNNFEHDSPDEYKLSLIINEVAYNERINISMITYPGWLKDSPVVSEERLLGDCASINKPTGAKLKRFVHPNTKKLVINELNKVSNDQADGIKQFIEDVADFKPKWVNPSRSTAGTRESCNLDNLSVMIFCNFPKQYTKTGKKVQYYRQKQDLIEFHQELGHEKIERRIFPLLFNGGEYRWQEIEGKKIFKVCESVKEDFSKTVKPITDEEYIYLRNWIKNRKYWEDKENRWEELGKRPWISKYADKIESNTFRINYKRIYNGIRLYSDNQQEADYWEDVLYSSHINYLEYIRDFTDKYEKEAKRLAEE